MVSRQDNRSTTAGRHLRDRRNRFRYKLPESHPALDRLDKIPFPCSTYVLMQDAETMAERHGRNLARIAELSLALAEDVQASALQAPQPEEKARLSVAF